MMFRLLKAMAALACISFSMGAVAQESGTTTAPVKEVPVKEAPVKKAPVKEAPVKKAPPVVKSAAPEGDFALLEAVVTLGVEEMQPKEVRAKFEDQEKAWIWMKFRNKTADEVQATLVWSRDGKEIERTSIAVKKSKRYRTWARRRMNGRDDRGAWTVEILDGSGGVLKSVAFTVGS